MKGLSFILLITIFLFSCDQADPPIPDPIAEGNPTQERGFRTDRRVDVAGVAREYHVFIPDEPLNAPVVMLFHDAGANHDELLGLLGGPAPYKLWLDIAERENILLVIPDGSTGQNGQRMWQDCLTEDAQADDVAFVHSLLDSLISLYQVNPNRVYLQGSANGGQFCFRLAQEMPERITAFAALMASQPVNSICSSSDVPVSALIMNGVLDPLVPYRGGVATSPAGELWATDSTIHYWVARNETDPSPINVNVPDITQIDDCRIETFTYPNGRNGTEVALFRVVNGGHNEPSAQERYSAERLAAFGYQNADTEMVEQVWQFFADKTR